MIIVSFNCWIFIMVLWWFHIILTAESNLRTIFYWYYSHIYVRYLQLFMYIFRCSSNRPSMYASRFVGFWVIHQTRRFPPSVSLIISHCYWYGFFLCVHSRPMVLFFSNVFCPEYLFYELFPFKMLLLLPRMICLIQCHKFFNKLSEDISDSINIFDYDFYII